MGPSEAELRPASPPSDPSAFDPGAAVHEEVSRGVESMVEQHTLWLELLAEGRRGEEYDWRTANLLSCIRSIEWDLQDLEDHVSIVEGNRSKFSSLGEDFIAERKQLIESVQEKIRDVRASVQEAQSSEGGHAAATAKATLSSLKAAMGRTRQYGKLKEEYKGSGSFQSGSSHCDAAAPPSAISNGRGAGAIPSIASDPPALPSYPTGGVMPTAPAAEKKRRWFLCCC